MLSAYISLLERLVFGSTQALARGIHVACHTGPPKHHKNPLDLHCGIPVGTGAVNAMWNSMQFCSAEGLRVTRIEGVEPCASICLPSGVAYQWNWIISISCRGFVPNVTEIWALASTRPLALHVNLP